jgi:hypothetical protein
MEDVLDLYEQPYDSERPLICFDERPCQLLGDLIVPLPMKPGHVRKEDYHYKREGTCCLLIAFEPLTGRRVVQVRSRRTKHDYAHFMKTLIEKHYPNVACIRLVQDNLNTHSAGAFYETFKPELAHRLKSKFEYHYTPKKASWLNMVEIELSILSKQCLDRRISSMAKLAKEVKALVQKRNRARATVNWRFTTTQARTKLQRRYMAAYKN